MSSINIPIMAGINATAAALPFAAATTSDLSMTSLCTTALSFLWGSVELIISMGAITAFSHLLCFAAALSLPATKQPNYPDLLDADEAASTAEKTCALILSALLSGLHVVVVFFMLPLFRLGGESFPIKNLYSIALLAAGTTGMVVGVIVVCLLVPVGKAFCRMLVGGTRERDVEALRCQEEEQKGFLDLEKPAFKLVVKDVDAEEEDDE